MVLSAVLLIIIATTTVYVGSKLSAGNSMIPLEAHEHTEMTMTQALIIPVSASIFLITLFFYFAYMQYFLIGILVMVGASALFQLTCITLQFLCCKMNSQLGLVLSLCFTIFAVLDWATTGDLVMHNLLGCSLCILFISTLRFPSLKVAAVCLLLLVVYDIFWVFFSEHFFHKNVMVEVATKVASNPVYEMGQRFHIDALKYVSPTVELPIKLMIPNYGIQKMAMLGLGDIALPGALVAFALRCDLDINNDINSDIHIKNTENDLEIGKSSHHISTLPIKIATVLFNYSITGYFIGLIAAFIGNKVTGMPQPALIYLVPGVLIFLIGKAWHIGQLKNIWMGSSKTDTSV